MPTVPLDAIDHRILHRLQENARVTNAELAKEVGLSPSPCLRRVQRLEKEGVIQGYAALVDPESVDFPVSVFISVTLDKQVEAELEVFEDAIRRRPEVMECYLMTGDSDYLLRVVTADVAAYRRFLLDHLTRIPGVASIKSSFSLKQVIHRTQLPLPGDEEGKPARPRPPARAPRLR